MELFYFPRRSFEPLPFSDVRIDLLSCRNCPCFWLARAGSAAQSPNMLIFSLRPYQISIFFGRVFGLPPRMLPEGSRRSSETPPGVFSSGGRGGDCNAPFLVFFHMLRVMLLCNTGPPPPFLLVAAPPPAIFVRSFPPQNCIGRGNNITHASPVR